MKLPVNRASIVLIATLASPVIAAPNLITNGDFEAGNSSFSTDYIFSSSPGSVQEYSVDSSIPNFWAAGFVDHTSGAGLMAIYNTSLNSNDRLWSQTVNLVSGVEYEFSGWVALLTFTPPHLDFRVNGASVGNFVAADVHAAWQPFSFVWTASSTGSVTIDLHELLAIFDGVDFAIDDLVLKQTSTVLPSGTLKDVHLISTLLTDTNELDTSSIIPTPHVTTQIDAQHTTVEWFYETYDASQVTELGFEVVLKDPKAGQTHPVTEKTELFYTDINNKARHITLDGLEVSVLPTVASIATKTDQSSYSANTKTQLSATIQNQSSHSSAFLAQLTVEDNEGRLITEWPLEQIATVFSGQSYEIGKIWNTSNTLAGDYVLHGLLYDSRGELIQDSRTAFAIQTQLDTNANSAASLTLNTDYPVYHVQGSVQLEHIAENLSGNRMLDNAQLRVTISNPQGQTVFNQTAKPIHLMPGALLPYALSYVFSDAPEGTYQVRSRLLDKVGAELAVAQTQYEVNALLVEPVPPVIVPSQEQAVKAIPVLSVWGLMLLSGLFSFIALFRQRK